MVKYKSTLQKRRMIKIYLNYNNRGYYPDRIFYYHQTMNFYDNMAPSSI